MFKQMLSLVLLFAPIAVHATLPRSEQQSSFPVSSPTDELDEIDYFQYGPHTEENNMLGNGNAGDTIAVVFTAETDWTLRLVEGQFNYPGTFDVFLFTYNEECAAMFPEGTGPSPLEEHVTPIGDLLLGPVHASQDSLFNGTYTQMVAIGDLPEGGLSFQAGEQFVVAIVKTTPGQLNAPFPFVDPMGDIPSHSWYGGPTYDNQWTGMNNAQSANLELCFRLGLDAPIRPLVIGEMCVLPSTYDTNRHYPVYTYPGDLYPYDQHWAYFHLLSNRGDHTAFAMEWNQNTSRFEADVSVPAAQGDTVRYWTEFETFDGMATSNDDLERWFQFLPQPRPTPHLLIVYRSSRSPIRTQVLQHLAANESQVIELWDIDERHGLDPMVLSREYAAVLLFTDGDSVLATRSGGYPPVNPEWFDSSNLLLADPSFFATHGEPVEASFGNGDLMFDVFGIIQATSDPQPGVNSFFGVSGDPIAGGFETEAFQLNSAFVEPGNHDEVLPADDAMPIFAGTDPSTVAGLRLVRPNGSRSIVLGFDPLAAVERVVDGTDTSYVPTGQLESLFTAMVNWLTIGTAELLEVRNLPATYSLESPRPNPFNASTLLCFTLPQNAAIEVSVFDLLGRRVTVLAKETRTSGTNTVSWTPAPALASGTYVIRLKTPAGQEVTRAVLLK